MPSNRLHVKAEEKFVASLVSGRDDLLPLCEPFFGVDAWRVHTALAMREIWVTSVTISPADARWLYSPVAMLTGVPSGRARLRVSGAMKMRFSS
ncbi:hypothetical protein [Paraburkholderia caledonica]|uniref:hypothetical protein n=1 Tax=Paraburkholderia caledonica TaxID=134536 RepID=UPI001178970B|nr:hypothetical protein [Paraburkholderia caledonica]